MLNPENEILNRRAFVRTIGLLVLGFILFTWYWLLSRHIETTGPKGFQKVNLSKQVDGVYFYDSFLVSKKGDSLSVFNNRCTHAGCKVNNEQKGEIVCACHGSAYNPLTGAVTRGPAVKSLTPLPYTVHPSSGEITVKLIN